MPRHLLGDYIVDKHADFDNLLPGWPPDSAMIDDNISEFNAQVTRAIATLYKAHPTKMDLGAEHILVPPVAKTDSDFEARMEFASGTLTWLYRNGLVTGELNETATFALILGAQLSARSYETF